MNRMCLRYAEVWEVPDSWKHTKTKCLQMKQSINSQLSRTMWLMQRSRARTLSPRESKWTELMGQKLRPLLGSRKLVPRNLRPEVRPHFRIPKIQIYSTLVRPRLDYAGTWAAEECVMGTIDE